MSKQEKSIEKLLLQGSKLNLRQKKFCEEFLVDLDATKAAIRAKYSEKSAYSIGSENLTKPKIRNYLRGLLTLRCIRTQVTSDKVIEELKKVAFATKDVKTRDKLKALDILAKHVGLFDKQIREFPEILKEKEPERKEQIACTENDWWVSRLAHFLAPMTREKFINELQKRYEQKGAVESNGATEAGLEPGDNGEEVEFNLLKVMKEVIGEERIKQDVQLTLDSILDKV